MAHRCGQPTDCGAFVHSSLDSRKHRHLHNRPRAQWVCREVTPRAGCGEHCGKSLALLQRENPTLLRMRTHAARRRGGPTPFWSLHAAESIVMTHQMRASEFLQFMNCIEVWIVGHALTGGRGVHAYMWPEAYCCTSNLALLRAWPRWARTCERADYPVLSRTQLYSICTTIEVRPCQLR
jgi:hypothetical protein